MNLGNKKIILVDGFKIRNTLDDDFGVFHQRETEISNFAPKFYIQGDEVWVDNRFKDECDYLLKVYNFIKPTRGQTYEQMRELAKEKFCAKGSVPEFVNRSEDVDGINVKYVNGAIVRRHIDPEFIFGGHEFVYSYIPENEIWLDEKMDPREIPYILLHEKIERELMKNGKSYDVAHEYATVADKEMRRRDGVGSYPGDMNYAWSGMSNQEIIQKEYVIKG